MLPTCQIVPQRVPTTVSHSLPNACTQTHPLAVSDAPAPVWLSAHQSSTNLALPQFRQMAHPSAPCRTGRDSYQRKPLASARAHISADTPDAPPLHKPAGYKHASQAARTAAASTRGKALSRMPQDPSPGHDIIMRRSSHLLRMAICQKRGKRQGVGNIRRLQAICSRGRIRNADSLLQDCHQPFMLRLCRSALLSYYSSAST